MTYRAHSMRTSDGLALHYRCYGPGGGGVPVLCLCGLSRNSDDFHEFGREFSGTRAVYTLDYRGRGLSDYDPCRRNYAAGVYVEDIRHLLSVLPVERVIVLGTSLGGLLAMGMAVEYPCRLAGVVLNDIGPEVDSATLRALYQRLEDTYSFPDWGSAVASVRAGNPMLTGLGDEEWLALSRRYYHEDHHGRVSMRWDIGVLEEARRASRGGVVLWGQFQAFGGFPVLVLRGEHSEILSRGCAEEMESRHGDLRVEEIADRGHVPFLDEPTSREALKRFFSRIDLESGLR